MGSVGRLDTERAMSRIFCEPRFRRAGIPLPRELQIIWSGRAPWSMMRAFVTGDRHLAFPLPRCWQS